MGLYVTLALGAAAVAVIALVYIFSGAKGEAWISEKIKSGISVEQSRIIALNREGESLVALYANDKNPANLHSAIAIYLTALDICKTLHLPMEEAITRNNIGTAYGILSGDEEREKNLRLAIAMFESSAEICEIEKLGNIKGKIRANLEKARTATSRIDHSQQA